MRTAMHLGLPPPRSEANRLPCPHPGASSSASASSPRRDLPSPDWRGRGEELFRVVRRELHTKPPAATMKRMATVFVPQILRRLIPEARVVVFGRTVAQIIDELEA